MSDLALYRKYRPQSFKEVLGQESVVKALEGAIAQGNIAHAYLFAGSRGTGKTSIARIFAREIGTAPGDLYEIDAASNRGIDDIRALREAVHVLPFQSRYKVYLIDEVHMLTKEAFNALLKTLEEPPKHAVFILATTEFEKLPETIISRCQSFTFKKPPTSVLKEMTLSVAKTEGREVEPASAELVALLGDGSFRDTLGIVQKIFSSTSAKKITLAEVEQVTGAPKSALINAFVGALHANNTGATLDALHAAEESGVESKVFLTMALRSLRAVLLLRYAADLQKTLREEYTEEDFLFLERCAKESGSAINAKALEAFLRAYTELGSSALPWLPIELAVITLSEKKQSV